MKPYLRLKVLLGKSHRYNSGENVGSKCMPIPDESIQICDNSGSFEYDLPTWMPNESPQTMKNIAYEKECSNNIIENFSPNNMEKFSPISNFFLESEGFEASSNLNDSEFSVGQTFLAEDCSRSQKENLTNASNTTDDILHTSYQFREGPDEHFPPSSQIEISQGVSEHKCESRSDSAEIVDDDRLKLREIVISDSNLKNFQQQIFDSGLTLEAVAESNTNDLVYFFTDYIKLKPFSAKLAAEALKRIVFSHKTMNVQIP